MIILLFLTVETWSSVDEKIDIFLCCCLNNIVPTTVGRKSIELTIETKELIVAMSESVKNKAELSRLLNIPRTTITSVLLNYKGMARWRI